jgi:hypothetical protein
VCARAFQATRADLRQRARWLEPRLRAHGLVLDRARLDDRARDVIDALCDPRPLRSGGRRDVHQTTRDLALTLDHLERRLAALR